MELVGEWYLNRVILAPDNHNQRIACFLLVSDSPNALIRQFGHNVQILIKVIKVKAILARIWFLLFPWRPIHIEFTWVFSSAFLLKVFQEIIMILFGAKQAVFLDVLIWLQSATMVDVESCFILNEFLVKFIQLGCGWFQRFYSLIISIARVVGIIFFICRFWFLPAFDSTDHHFKRAFFFRFARNRDH